MPSTEVRALAARWNQACLQQQHYAQNLRNQRNAVAINNSGHTADDLIFRFHRGEQFHLDLAEKYQTKAKAFYKSADAVDLLRSELTKIADGGNKQIDDIMTSHEPLTTKLTSIHLVQSACNAAASNASSIAVETIVSGTRDVLRGEGIETNAEIWMRDHGFNADSAPAPHPIDENDLESMPVGNSSRDGDSAGARGVTAASSHRVPGNESWTGSGQTAGGTKGNGLASEPSLPGGQSWNGRPIASVGPPVPASPSPTSVPLPGGGGPLAPQLPAAPSGPISPAAVGQGLSSGPMGQALMTGMATGQPVAGSAQSLTQGALNAMGQGAPPPSQVATPMATPPVMPPPAVSSGESFATAHAPVAAPVSMSSAPTNTEVAPVPPVMTGGSWSASPVPVVNAPAMPAGALPAYGSDLRPPVGTLPAVPSVPAASASGAAVSPPAASAGGTFVSPVERAASGSAAGQAGTSSSEIAGRTVSSAITGATAGAASSRATEIQRLQRLVDAVARQEPRLSWASGLRDDGTTSLLVTDLAGGWVPAHVRLPAGVTLLEPMARRRDASAVELLGAVTAAAAHQPYAYIGEPAPDEPALTGDRAARSAAPKVDELGPTLVEAVRRRDGLPRIAQALAAPAARKTGVLATEAELLRECTAEVQRSVVSAYPRHNPAAVGDWMLLAAIEALIDEHVYLANYHLAWFDVISRTVVNQNHRSLI